MNGKRISRRIKQEWVSDTLDQVFLSLVLTMLLVSLLSVLTVHASILFGVIHP